LISAATLNKTKLIFILNKYDMIEHVR